MKNNSTGDLAVGTDFCLVGRSPLIGEERIAEGDLPLSFSDQIASPHGGSRTRLSALCWLRRPRLS